MNSRNLRLGTLYTHLKTYRKGKVGVASCSILNSGAGVCTTEGGKHVDKNYIVCAAHLVVKQCLRRLLNLLFKA